MNPELLEELDRREQRYAEIRNKQLRDAMTDIENPAGKVADYTAQPDAKVALVNEFKADEERLLRKLDNLYLFKPTSDDDKVNQRWVAIAKTHFQEGFMALNRAVLKQGRVKLPEDAQ